MDGHSTAAQTAATGVQAAQAMSRTTVQALETTAHQAHQLGAALDEELRPTVEGVNTHLNNFFKTKNAEFCNLYQGWLSIL